MVTDKDECIWMLQRTIDTASQAPIIEEPERFTLMGSLGDSLSAGLVSVRNTERVLLCPMQISVHSTNEWYLGPLLPKRSRDSPQWLILVH